MDGDRPNPEHLKAYFTAELPASGLPARFGIVTAHNPGSVVSTPDVNQRADKELEKLLVAEGLPHFRATGGSRDGSHREPGYGIVADSLDVIRPISRFFRQEAFFWVENGAVFVVNTEGARLHRIGEWAALQRPI